jgi:ABC-2 type transport system ATP-binding protein
MELVRRIGYVIIQSEALNKSFRGHDALRGISLAVPEWSIYAMIGANGAGKTTTIKTLLNILTPTSGRAEVLGVDSRRLSPRAGPDHGGMVLTLPAEEGLEHD